MTISIKVTNALKLAVAIDVMDALCIAQGIFIPGGTALEQRSTQTGTFSGTAQQTRIDKQAL